MIRQNTNHIIGEPLDVQPGEGELRFALESLPLLDDEYRITVVAREFGTNKELDRQNEATGFRVKGPQGDLGRVLATIRFEGTDGEGRHRSSEPTPSAAEVDLPTTVSPGS